MRFIFNFIFMKKITTTKELFVAKDWTQFETEEACIIYELETQKEYIESEIVIPLPPNY